MRAAVDHNVVVKVFNGYGHQQSLVIYGQVKRGPRKKKRTYTFSVLRNIYSIAKLYFIKPLPFARVRLQWNDQVIETTADDDGFFKLEWRSVESTPGGWWPVQIHAIDEVGNPIGFGNGKIFVPHITQLGVISDIDDTVLVSHSARTGKKITTLLTTNPLKRKTFSDVVRFYQMLSLSRTEPEVRNPFFYVSSSEWNLYDYLSDFFKSNKLPEGIFLLAEFKRVGNLLKKTIHRGKGERARRILEAFPNQRFILVGDNSQKDPFIYSEIANEHPFRIEAIYIRVVRKERKEATISVLESIRNKNIHVHLFENTNEAIEHAKNVGLISI